MSRLPGTLATVLLVAAATFGIDDQPAAVSLFDGKSLEGWVPEHSDGFSVADSAILAKGGPGWLRSARTYKNFELDLEYRLVDEGSEGALLFRAGPESASAEPFWPAKGYRLQLAGGDGNFMLFGHGTPPPRFERKTDALREAVKEVGAWQKLNLRVIEARMEAKLNDVLVVSSDALEPAAGHLGLIGKTGRVEWRGLTIRAHPD